MSADTALSDEEVASRVRKYLNTIDTPISAAQWQALGTRAVPELEKVVKSDDALPSHRAKAVGALSIIGGDIAKSVVLDVARSEDEPFAVRASALRGMPRLLPSDQLASQLRPILESSRELPVRATVAEVLARHGGAAACPVVRAQVDRESRHDRPAFTRAVNQCSPAP